MISIEDRLTELEARSRMLKNHRVHYLGSRSNVSRGSE
jgi:hypothetical protein